jgi:renalase
MHDKSQRVGVIGAGIAGLAAAGKLQHCGYQVQVFDKGRGVGGRISVRREPPFEFDHGAQYFTVRDERFAQQVRQWERVGIVEPWTGRIGSWHAGLWQGRSTCPRYIGVPGMNVLAKDLARDLNVATATRIASISRQQSRWTLQTDEDQHAGEFDALVVALPAEQATTLIGGQSDLSQSATKCRLSPCWAVMLGFEEPIGIPYDGVFVNDSPLAWVARNSSKSQRSGPEAWVLHANPEWSTAHLEDAPEPVMAALTEAFQQLSSEPIQKAIHAAAHRWRYALPLEPLELGAFWDAGTQLAMCGDWCCGSRVEGAYLSGLAAAEHVLNSMKTLSR